MNPILKNVLAVVAGVIIGSVVNMGIIMISGSIIPPPEGGDITTMEGLKSTLVGAFVAAKIAAGKKMLMALLVGLFFLIGGTVNIAMLGGPMWFTALDIIVAYMPMGYLGYVLAKR